MFSAQMAALGLGSQPQSLINGVLMDGTGDTITLVDPYTEQPLVAYPDAGAELANAACVAAQTAQTQWAALSGAARGLVMQDIARTVLSNAEPLATIEALVAGKPIRDCRVEVGASKGQHQVTIIVDPHARFGRQLFTGILNRLLHAFVAPLLVTVRFGSRWI